MPPIPPQLLAAGISSGMQTGAGLLQMIFSGRKKAERELNSQLGSNPIYNPSKGIRDYYTEALSGYKESPYQSAQYQTSVRDAQRGTSQGIGALQDRRSALSGINRLVGIQNDATQNAAVQAEQQRNQRFGQVGDASNMLAAEERRAFDINKMNPYMRRLNLAQMKLGAANARFDAGMSNLFKGASNASAMAGMMGGNSGSSFNRGDFSGNQ